VIDPPLRGRVDLEVGREVNRQHTRCRGTGWRRERQDRSEE
jgi:hypothetical protein